MSFDAESSREPHTRHLLGLTTSQSVLAIAQTRKQSGVARWHPPLCQHVFQRHHQDFLQRPLVKVSGQCDRTAEVTRYWEGLHTCSTSENNQLEVQSCEDNLLSAPPILLAL